MIRRLWRRVVARKWRCRCGNRVFDLSALTPHPAAPSRPGCAWHENVREGVLSGRISRADDAR